MFVQSREDSREFFLNVWKKMGSGAPLEPLETVVAQVISAHPEYHAMLSAPDSVQQDMDVSTTNPFLHMGLHIALAEQLQTDRPAGIRAAYQALSALGNSDAHGLEHRIMDHLAEVLWRASQTGSAPDDQAYLSAVRRLAQ